MTTYNKGKGKLVAGSVAAILGIGAIGYGLTTLPEPGNTNVPVKGRSSEAATTRPNSQLTNETESPRTRPTSKRPPIKKPVKPSTSPKPTSTEVYFKSCKDVWNSGDPDGLRKGEPGYRPGLDGDGDGTACENRG